MYSLSESCRFSWLHKCGWVTGGNNASRAPAFLLTLVRLERLTRWLEEEHRVKLSRVQMTCVRDIKEFCDGSLVLSVPHAWHKSLRACHAGLRTRASVCASLFLFRKVVPVSALTKAQQADVVLRYIEKMTSPLPEPSAEFSRFVVETVEKEFSRGWDRAWFNASDSFTLPVKSCLENRSGAGGARGYIHGFLPGTSRFADPRVWRNGIEMSSIQADYLDFVEPDESVRRRVKLGLSTKIMTIYTGGKNRTVSMFSARRSFLKPLHTIMYDYLSKKPWLLRGEATSDRFSTFTRVEGEVLVSGDYESATDNLNLSVSQLILKTIRSRSVHVPTQVWDEAEACLVNVFQDGSVQRRGQLMGSLLSFPLLCLTNYIGLKWSIGRSIPVRINGDDIVFRATPAEYEKWQREVVSAGLTLSKGKTLVTKTLFSLNSNFFLSRRDRIEAVPHIRSSCVWDKPEVGSAVAGKIGRCVVEMPSVEPKVHVEVLRTCHKMVLDTQRSVTRGLECRVHHRVLVGAGLMEREAFYYSLDKEPSLPPPFKRWQDWKMLGWRSVVVTDGEDDIGAGAAMVASTWECPVTHTDISHEAYRRALRSGTFKYIPHNRKYFKMLRYTGHTFEAFCRQLPRDVRRKAFRPRDGGKRVWRRQSACRPVDFAPAGA